jgi:hypothetical protein
MIFRGILDELIEWIGTKVSWVGTLAATQPLISIGRISGA